MIPVGMSIKSITVKYGRRQNLGNYNSADFEVILSAEVETIPLDGLTPEEATTAAMLNAQRFETASAALWELARNQVKENILRLLRPAPAIAEEVKNAN